MQPICIFGKFGVRVVETRCFASLPSVPAHGISRAPGRRRWYRRGALDCRDAGRWT